MKILKEDVISAFEAKNHFKDVDDESLSFEQKITKDFLNKYYNFDEKIYSEVKSELEKMELKPHQIAMILNVLPEDEMQVKAIFAKERTSPSEEDIKKIVELCIKLKA
ncbi:MAG: hypothetical protein GXN99_00080 [Candidatus Nanohaloarchaeota archaeon]|nr:hypothetical protein [Candidatus Nanohaloarchaeota archaeon]